MFDDDLQEEVQFFAEKQQRMVEALKNMELKIASQEDKELIWAECGISRNLFMADF